MTIQTHYDNLHIHQNADQHTIRQAYRRLSKQYHPDINPDPNAHRIMQLINQAYEVLSDPKRRAEHDQWIQEQLLKQQPIIQTSHQPINSPITLQKFPHYTRHIQWSILAIIILTLLLGGQLYYLLQEKLSQNNQIATTETVAYPISYHRPITAPNGNPWPQESGYIPGYPLIYGQQNHQINIENILNSSDVYAELISLNHAQALRTFFIKERSHFRLDKLDAGEYIIQYKQLDAGEELATHKISINQHNHQPTIYLKRGNAPQY